MPAGRTILSDEGDGEIPTLWLSDEPATVELVTSLRAEHPHSGLWPLLLDALDHQDPEYRPLLTGQVETRAQFEAEPTAYRWIFYRQDTTVWIRIVELRHGALHDNAGTELWSSWQPVDRLVRGKLPCGAGCTVRSTWSPRPTNSEAFTGASLVRVRS